MKGMRSFVLRRLASALPTLLLLALTAFVMMRAAPGGPFDAERALPPEIEARLQAKYGLADPLHEQFLNYLGSLLRGDLGPSFQYPDYSVNELIAAGLPVSATLGGLALLAALLLGGAAGALAAFYRDTLLDRLVTGLAVSGICIPVFVVGPLLILLFAIHAGWLPAGGWNGGDPAHLLLPVVTLALPQIAHIARLMRGGLLEVLESPWMRAARARGIPAFRRLWRHAGRPALLPLLSYLGPTAAGILTGSVIVEEIFGLPGIGRYFVQGALNRDYTLVMGVVLLYGALIILFNLLVDLAYGWLDPRIRRA